MRSNEPEALFSLGLRLANADASRDVWYGMAIALAACDLGYDCSANNPSNPWYECSRNGQCAADMTFRSSQMDQMSPSQFARVDALAEQFKEACSRGLWDELERFIALDGTAFR